MILKQLKQLTLSATRRNNAHHILRLPRLYSSPAAVSQSLTKPSKRLSRDDRRLVVESFVSKYRAANAGKFPTLKATVREVGGGYYIVRDILQELKLRPNAPVSRVPASVANDASSSKQDHTMESSHSISDEVSSLQGDNSLIESTSDEVSPQGDSSLLDSSHSISDEVSLQGDNSLIESSHPSSDEVGLQGDNSLIESSHFISDEVSLQGDNSLVIPATHDRSETVTASVDKDVDCKCDGSSSTHFPEIQTLKVSEECLKKPEIEEEETLKQIASQEPRADHIEGGAASASVLPTETRQVPKKEDDEVNTVENSSAWSNIVSFAREFVSFWRKG